MPVTRGKRPERGSEDLSPPDSAIETEPSPASFASLVFPLFSCVSLRSLLRSCNLFGLRLLLEFSNRLTGIIGQAIMRIAAQKLLKVPIAPLRHRSDRLCRSRRS